MKRNERASEVRIIPVPFGDEIKSGDSLAERLCDAIATAGLTLNPGDILVVKHKIVSKAEGRFVELDSVRPSARSRAWGRKFEVDARVIQLALAESKRVVRRKRGVLITETRHGFVCANSGIDVSNVNGGRHALLLPKDPDASASRLRREITKQFHVPVPVIITDSFGRAWREGLTEVAIGIAGMKAMRDYRGQLDSHGHPLRVSIDAVADEIACAAGLVCGKLARTPACIIRGFQYHAGRGRARDLIRPAKQDLFR